MLFADYSEELDKTIACQQQNGIDDDDLQIQHLLYRNCFVLCNHVSIPFLKTQELRDN